MKVGLIGYDFYPPIGGMGVEAYQLYRALKERRDVDVLVASSRRNDLVDHIRVPAVNAHGLGPISFSLMIGRKAGRIAAQRQLDLLQVYGGPGGVFLLQNPRVPVVYVANHTYAQQSRYLGKWIYGILARLERRSYRFARRIIAISTTTRESLVDDYGIDPDRVTVIPVGIDASVFRPTGAEKTAGSVLYVGRLCERKNIPCLFEAIGIVKRSVPGVRLSLVGDGILRKKLEELAREKGLSDTITFLGKVSEGELVDLYSKAQVFVLPSLFEGFGIVCLEAMACGTPVVATRVPGIVDIVDDGRTGVLVSGDSREMAGAIQRLLMEPETRSTIAVNGREEVLERFDWAKVTERIVEVYRAVGRKEQRCGVT